MWIHCPKFCLDKSPSPDSAPGWGCLNSESTSPLHGADYLQSLYVFVSGKPSRRPRSWRGWKQRTVIARLSGTTSPRSTVRDGVDRWISHVRGCRALPTRVPENERVIRIIARGVIGRAVDGLELGDRSRIFCESLTKCDPPWSSSKMFRNGLQAGIFEDSERHYRDWVTRSHNRSSLLRKMLARRTSANGSLLWRSALATWGTPSALESQSYSGFKKTSKGGRELATDAMNWPTPKHRDAKGMSQRGTDAPGDALENSVTHWTTPNANERGPETKQSKQNRPAAGGVDLQTQAMNWATPVNADATSNKNSMKALAKGFQGTLSDQCQSFHQQETITDHGQPLPNWTPPACPRLNPVFQWWLMGMPSPTAIFSESAVTQFALYRRQLLSMYCLIK